MTTADALTLVVQWLHDEAGQLQQQGDAALAELLLRQALEIGRAHV